MKLKCISSRLNYVGFDDAGNPKRVVVGQTFNTTGDTIPDKWIGLVVAVSGEKVAVTNPEGGGVVSETEATTKTKSKK